MSVPEQLPSHTVEGHPQTGTFVPPTMPGDSDSPDAARGTKSPDAHHAPIATQRSCRRTDIRISPELPARGPLAGELGPIRGRTARFPLQKRLDCRRVPSREKRAGML